MTPEMIRAEYPEILSSEQIRQILGISKRKASLLLNNGHIPCQISEKETRKYKIKREDLIAYLSDREKHPEKYIVPKGVFSTAKTTQRKEEGYPMVLPQDFREWLEDEWYNLPHDLITTKEWLVEFYCSAGYEPRYMCEKHKKLTMRYLKER